jgi:diguanylate cyclase (GGDEF)-like protein
VDRKDLGKAEDRMVALPIDAERSTADANQGADTQRDDAEGSESSADQTGSDADQTGSDADQTGSDADQSGSDADQSGSDADQSGSDADQTAEDRDEADAARDQRAADEDQAIADQLRDATAESGAQEAYEASRLTREATRIHRLATHEARARSAGSRVDTAAERDATSATRDETARRRGARTPAIDRTTAASEAPVAQKTVSDEEFDTIEAAVARAREHIRARAEADRARAAADRERAAEDRAEAARERARLQLELNNAHLDDLTGAFRREMGRLALTHEIDHARRGDGRFVIAFVDVDGMKSVNDREGHAAGDHVLRTLVTAMRSNLRSFDPVVRYGGDEFVCGLGGADLEEVERRFALIHRAVKSEVGVGISVGFAALAAGETLDDVTSRADAALLESKRGRGA